MRRRRAPQEGGRDRRETLCSARGETSTVHRIVRCGKKQGDGTPPGRSHGGPRRVRRRVSIQGVRRGGGPLRENGGVLPEGSLNATLVGSGHRIACAFCTEWQRVETFAGFLPGGSPSVLLKKRVLREGVGRGMGAPRVERGPPEHTLLRATLMSFSPRFVARRRRAFGVSRQRPTRNRSNEGFSFIG